MYINVLIHMFLKWFLVIHFWNFTWKDKKNDINEISMAVHGYYVLSGARKSGTCTLFKRAHTHCVLSLKDDARPSQHSLWRESVSREPDGKKPLQKKAADKATKWRSKEYPSYAPIALMRLAITAYRCVCLCMYLCVCIPNLWIK